MRIGNILKEQEAEHVQNNLNQLDKIRQGLQKGGSNTKDKLTEIEARIKLLEEYIL